MTNKETYKILCESEPSIPIYSRDWWLDCVCGKDKWDVLLSLKDNEIEAAMLIYLPLKGVITMPPYTQVMGIWFNPAHESESYSKNLYRKQLLCDYFISHLPPHHYFLQNFHYSFTDWLPFYWKGYRQTTRYNYILPDIKNPDKWENQLSGDVKRNISKARDKYRIEIKRNISTELFMRINNLTFERQKTKTVHPETLQKIIDVSRSKNQGDIWGAFDEQGRLHAAVFIVWQDSCAYYIAGGSDPELRGSGAHAYALWKAIGDVAEHSSSFDFEGSMIQGVEHFFRGFGAIQMPFYTLSKGKIYLIERIARKILSGIR
jgi:lipid II:glycine glycyltransferase (peptidoglycan interpeptide bridge formation enzyme)